jgi:hypothetical protein
MSWWDSFQCESVSLAAKWSAPETKELQFKKQKKTAHAKPVVKLTKSLCFFSIFFSFSIIFFLTTKLPGGIVSVKKTAQFIPPLYAKDEKYQNDLILLLIL